MKRKQIVFASLIATFMVGCTARGPKTPREAAGEYMSRYRSGEVEVVILHPDLTYRQEFYRDLQSYQTNATAAYTNAGTWSYKRSAMTFDRWLLFCDYPYVDKVLDNPKPSASLPGHWEPATAKWDAAIWFSEDPHYVFVRVKK